LNSNEYNILIADAIRATRELRRQTQQQTAQAIGMSRSSYSKLENGQHQITISTLFIISKVLQTNVFQILTLAEARNKNPSDPTSVSHLLISFVSKMNENLTYDDVLNIIQKIKTSFEIKAPKDIG
jgi:transcriptional regulator with XRE-family HTH domain